MAKKVVATFKDKTAKVNLTKVVIPVRNPKTGAYAFKEEIIPAEQVESYLKANTPK